MPRLVRHLLGSGSLCHDLLISFNDHFPRYAIVFNLCIAISEAASLRLPFLFRKRTILCRFDQSCQF